MNSYLDLDALARVLLYSLTAGLLITASVAVGARAFAQAEGLRATARSGTRQFALAGACFALAAVAAVAGVWFVLDK